MSFAYVSSERNIMALAAGVLLLSSLSLGGCATSTGSSSPMDARAEAPASAPSAYLPLEVLPPKRAVPSLTVDERSTLQKELTALRDLQTARSKAAGGLVPQ